MTIVTMVIAFYFGTQSEGKGGSKELSGGHPIKGGPPFLWPNVGRFYYELFTKLVPTTNHLRSTKQRKTTHNDMETQTKNRDTATFAVCIAVFTLAE